jgi:hypothetical protein
MPSNRRSFLGGALAATGVAALPAYAVPTPDRLAPAAMAADVRLLRRAYETLHPGLLRYADAGEMAARFDRLEAATARPMTLAAFYILLSQLLASVRCGHSYANFYNQSAAVQRVLFDAPDRLPFHFLWIGDRMIVTDPQDSGLARGDAILTIEGRPAAAILAGLMTVARADGGNDAKRRRLMSVQGEDGYESFDIFYPLLFGGRSAYRLEVRGADGRRRRARVAAISLAARRAQRPPRAPDSGNAPGWTIERRGRAAVLTMPGWALYDSKWDWRGWIDAAVDRLVADGVAGLVVDLRANEGGLDCGDALVARLTEAPVAASPARRLVRYRSIPADLRPHLSTWDRSFDDWGADATPYDARYFTLARRDAEGATIVPKGERFTGRVAVLIGPQNSSATFQFAQLVQRERLATLIGEPSGGNRRGINGGAFYFVRLPATGLEADLPLIGYFPPITEPDAGIIPDRLVPVTQAAIAAGRDEAMVRALEAVAG